MDQTNVHNKSTSFSARRKNSLLAKKRKKGNRHGTAFRTPSKENLTNLFDHYKNGRFTHVIKMGSSLTENFPDHPFAWSLLGAALCQMGRMDEALVANQKALELSPKNPNSHNNLGTVFQHLGWLNEAESCFKCAISFNREYAEAHNNLGNTLKCLGRLIEAEASCLRAISLKSNFPEAHYNLGNVLLQLERQEEAAVSYKIAISQKPSYSQAYNNLGTVLQDLGKVSEALTNYEKAIELAPCCPNAYCNIAYLLKKDGNLEDSLHYYSKAVKLKPDHPEALSGFSDGISGLAFDRHQPEIQNLIYQLLTAQNIARPADLAIPIMTLLKQDPSIVRILEVFEQGEIEENISEVISQLSDIPLLLEVMSVCPIPDIQFEALLQNIRACLLKGSLDIEVDNDVITFQIALCLQCFTNEYIYSYTKSEAKLLNRLENLVEEKLFRQEKPSIQSLLALASYKSLNEYNWCSKLAEIDQIEQVFVRQVSNSKNEQTLKIEMNALEDITDNTSLSVRDQYEKNPYPRWVSLKIFPEPKKLNSLIELWDLRVCGNKDHFQNPNILIAGCGTGQHSIEAAMNIKGSKVLAVDLSLASLAYAKRCSHEIKVPNIDYLHADILDLSQLNQKFDVIESVGVLHHIKDPMEGWQSLVNCLKPGGLMNIGLYSHLARREIREMRDSLGIELESISRSDILRFRQQIIASDLISHDIIKSFQDFYSTSELRDLLFHVQEHNFTIPQIQEYLSSLGLRFSGFSCSAETLRKFKSENKSREDVYDLNKWSIYESSNPETFRGMYQFWCQKI